MDYEPDRDVPAIRVFIASSAEAKLVAIAASAVMKDLASHYRQDFPELSGAEFRTWATMFEAGSRTLDTLVAAASDSGFGVFVLAGDDVVTRRGAERSVPRDNVIYELGLFTGSIGLDRVFVLSPPDIEVPSDLLDVVRATFEPPSDSNDSGALRSALEFPCHQIVDAMRKRIAQQEAEREEPAMSATGKVVQQARGQDLLLSDLMADLHRGRLAPLSAAEDGVEGRSVVHAVHGVGTLVSASSSSRAHGLVVVQFADVAMSVPAQEVRLVP